MRQAQINLRETQVIGNGTRERIVHPNDFSLLRKHRIRLLGMSWIRSGEFKFCRILPDMLQVLVVLRGKGRGLIEGQWQPLKAGSAYVTPPGRPHAYEAAGRWEIAWCIFEPEVFSTFESGPVIRDANPASWHALVSGLCEECADPVDDIQIEHWTRLLHHASARLVVGDEERRLWRLWSLVSEDLRAPWTVALLAQRAGMSEETLRVTCQREQGRSPMAHLTLLRMRHAIAILETGQKVDYVSGLVGYENAFAFSTAFRRVIGAPPSEFKPGKKCPRP